jgi:adenylosuccinate synthase
MSGFVLVGTQWGDEGKGKITNYYAARADMVVRFQGGANAGHTVKVGKDTVVFHLLPSGISVPGVTCVIGPGVVADPFALALEADYVRSCGIRVDENLLIDMGVHLVMPYHKAIEAAEEEARGGNAIGTTHRGIGPAYADKYAREGVTFGDLTNESLFERKLRTAIARKNRILTGAFGAAPIDADDLLARMAPVRASLARHVSDARRVVRDALDHGDNVLFEGAQGALLDVTFGTYPYVTSSHTTAAGVAPGTGVAPGRIGTVVGVTKAYTTRVGAGPFPTETDADASAVLAERGAEFGATTGRPRRCGWLDLVALRYSLELSGVEHLVVTKMDVLDTMERIPVCVAYSVDGTRTDEFPRDLETLRRVEPVFETLPGWMSPTGAARSPDALPAAALSYLDYIAKSTSTDVVAVSVGAASDAIVELGQVL